MSECICHVELKEVLHTGSDIGDDWVFSIEVDGVRRSIDMRGTGRTEDRVTFARRLRWTTYGHPCGSVMSVGVTVAATEKDLVFDDHGEGGGTFLVACPGPGGAPRVYPGQEIVIRVEERPLGDAMVHWVTFVFELTTICEAQ